MTRWLSRLSWVSVAAMVACGLWGCGEKDDQKTAVKTEAPKTDLGEPAADDAASMLEDLPDEQPAPESDSAKDPADADAPETDAAQDEKAPAETAPQSSPEAAADTADTDTAESQTGEESTEVFIEVDREEEDE